jgi:hypothetical protein
MTEAKVIEWQSALSCTDRGQILLVAAMYSPRLFCEILVSNLELGLVWLP